MRRKSTDRNKGRRLQPPVCERIFHPSPGTRPGNAGAAVREKSPEDLIHHEKEQRVKTSAAKLMRTGRMTTFLGVLISSLGIWTLWKTFA